MFRDEVDDGRTAFPIRLIPYLSHDLVVELPDAKKRDLIIRRLYSYLEFVANLEAKVVNRGTQVIALNTLGLGVDTAIRLDAWKIYCDEAHHAHNSFDMIHQVEVATGVRELPYRFDHVLDRLELAGRHLAVTDGLAHLLQVVVFETLVTALLEDIPRDPSVITAVREVVGDHARDERLHHAFYAKFFDYLWGTLDPRTRERAARCLPEIVIACLSPDLPAIESSLRAAGLGASEVDQVLGETYSRSAVLADVRLSARHTLKIFTDHGVLDLPGTYEAFECAGLLPEEDTVRGPLRREGGSGE